MWSEEKLREYYSKLGFKGVALEDKIKEHSSKQDPFTSELSAEDLKHTTPVSKIKKNDRAVEGHRKYLLHKGIYDLGYVGGIGYGVLRQMPLVGAVTDVMDLSGLTSDWGTGNSEILNEAPEASAYDYLSQSAYNTAKSVDPLGKTKPIGFLKRFPLKYATPLHNITKRGALFSKFFGGADRVADGLQLMDHVMNYNPPKESDYYKQGGKFKYLCN